MGGVASHCLSAFIRPNPSGKRRRAPRRRPVDSSAQDELGRTIRRARRAGSRQIGDSAVVDLDVAGRDDGEIDRSAPVGRYVK